MKRCADSSSRLENDGTLTSNDKTRLLVLSKTQSSLKQQSSDVKTLQYVRQTLTAFTDKDITTTLQRCLKKEWAKDQQKCETCRQVALLPKVGCKHWGAALQLANFVISPQNGLT
ncbi:hypothetical protein M514_08193 [Trichuris suis]|uniref:Uncharacterized protein n=1 Tax=Trichuris suis TaxID=68888 RepID=A0A085N7B2_9BILA|nr:hypothetical protein M514_08193 [Trichuris suis]